MNILWLDILRKTGLRLNLMQALKNTII
jgi:hypothetical protein